MHVPRRDVVPGGTPLAETVPRTSFGNLRTDSEHGLARLLG
jgi:hypothetical protein